MSPPPQNGPFGFELSHIVQSVAVLGEGKQMYCMASPAKSHVSPPAMLQGAPVTGLQFVWVMPVLVEPVGAIWKHEPFEGAVVGTPVQTPVMNAVLVPDEVAEVVVLPEPDVDAFVLLVVPTVVPATVVELVVPPVPVVLDLQPAMLVAARPDKPTTVPPMIHHESRMETPFRERSRSTSMKSP